MESTLEAFHSESKACVPHSDTKTKQFDGTMAAFAGREQSQFFLFTSRTTRVKKN